MTTEEWQRIFRLEWGKQKDPMKVPRRFLAAQVEEDHQLVKDLCNEVDDDDSYTEWEQDFVSDIAVRFETDTHAVLSDKQRDILERIRDKPKKW